MSESDSLFYETHVFCCVNQRRDGHPRGCCAEKGSGALRDYMKARGKALKLKKVRINQAGCLDRCELGPTLVIYPEGTWYHYRNEADIDEILERHVMKGEQVDRLLLRPDQTALDTP
ncbi:MAG: (2Fe-2S) ferredoxin domain-containing protein [Alphaproteobacteria bacterium]